MANKQSYLGEFEHLVLLSIMQLSDNAYGVTVRRYLKETINRDVSIGALYATVERLEKKGFITSRKGEAKAERGGKAMMKQSEAEKRGLTPLCKIVAHATHAQKPEEFTVAPVGAMNKVLAKANWTAAEVDLWEINEAFAMVTMLAIKELALDVEKVNVNGGACALGHPLGASGARIMVTLVHALKNKGLSKGLASLCIGGGEATAIAVEML